MTQKERITWYLGLRQLVKLPNNHIAPVVALLKKQAKAPGLVTSGSTPTPLRQRVSLIHRSITLGPPTSALFHHNKSQVPGLDVHKMMATSSASLLPTGRFGKLPMSSQIATKHNHQLSIMHTHFDNPGHWLAPTNQPMGLKELSPIATMGSVSFSKTPFAPAQAYALPPRKVNDELQEAVSRTTPHQFKATSSNRDLEVRQSSFELPYQDKLNASISMQERDSFVDREEAPLGAFASTLHLDGSSLGRWVVQHLEKVLSKPPSGMTGVDPRATAPRTRVAPF